MILISFYSFFFRVSFSHFHHSVFQLTDVSLYHLIQYWFLLVYFKIAVIVFFISGSSLHFLFVEDFQLFFQYSPEFWHIFTVITLNCLLGRLLIPTILSFFSGVLSRYFFGGGRGLILLSSYFAFFFLMYLVGWLHLPILEKWHFGPGSWYGFWVVQCVLELVSICWWAGQGPGGPEGCAGLLEGGPKTQIQGGIVWLSNWRMFNCIHKKH